MNQILLGNNIDTLKTLPDNSVHCCITSPPYFNLRNYGEYAEQIGLEESPEIYIEKLICVFKEVYRVLKEDGTCWVNIGDSYNGSGKNNGNTKTLYNKQSSNTASHNVKPLQLKFLSQKSLIGIPWRFAFAMMEMGWILRQDIIWAKPSPMPESVIDRFCKSHEYIFLFTKKTKYYFDHKHALEPATGYDYRKNEIVKTGEYEKETKGTPIGKERKRWPKRGYINKNGKTGLSEQHHGKSITTYPLRTKRDVWEEDEDVIEVIKKPRAFAKKGNKDRNDTGNLYSDTGFRLKRDVWVVATEPSEISHFAMFPQKLILPCILCGCPENGIVLDPFMGSGTTAVVAMKNFRRYIGCEINPEYVRIAEKRISQEKGLFDE